jgi:hypothetical protein
MALWADGRLLVDNEAIVLKKAQKMACGFSRDYKEAAGGSVCEGLDV